MAQNFETVIQEYHPIIYKICRVYSSEHDFDDLYQEILISIWSGLKRFKEQSKLSTWLYRVALNTALTYQRRAKKQPHTQDLGYLKEKMQQIETPNEQINQLYEAIRQLNTQDRALIFLYLEEKKYDEMAEITGMSASNVGVKINRIKKKLFSILNQMSK